MANLNAMFERYGKKFPSSLQAMKAMGGKLDEDSGKIVHLHNDWLAVLDGPTVDAKELERYAHLLYGTKDEDWKAVRMLGLKTGESDVVVRLRPKSYGLLLELADTRAKMVYEMELGEFSRTPRE